MRKGILDGIQWNHAIAQAKTQKLFYKTWLLQLVDFVRLETSRKTNWLSVARQDIITQRAELYTCSKLQPTRFHVNCLTREANRKNSHIFYKHKTKILIKFNEMNFSQRLGKIISPLLQIIIPRIPIYIKFSENFKLFYTTLTS